MLEGKNNIPPINQQEISNIDDISSFSYACSYSDRLINKLVSINKDRSKENRIDILKVKKAISFARTYHGEQKRDSGEPFYSHPLEVAYMLAEYSSTEDRQYFRTDLLVSAILHDTLEDTSLTFDMIKENFGEIVACQVKDLTRVKVHGKISSEELVLALLSEENKDMLMIKMFDRLHNLQTIKAKAPEKIKKIIDETIKVFLFLGVYLDMPQITNILIKYCYQHLHVKQKVYSLTDINSVFSTHNFQLPALTSQSA